jgi:transcriptional regulator with XRE-family HTH domain
MSRELTQIGQRLRAWRLGSGLSADEVAARLNLSRAAVYRFERYGINRIDSLERVARVLGTSIASLLEVNVEYIANAVTYFERLRQVEDSAERLFVLFSPAYLLTSDAYDAALGRALLESIPTAAPDGPRTRHDVGEIMAILARRKATYRRRRPTVINIVSAPEIERLARLGLSHGDVVAEPGHMQAVATELVRLAEMIRRPPMGVQIGVMFDVLPTTSFSIARGAAATHVCISPFRLGWQPNVRNGVAMITSAQDAVKLHLDLAERLWQRAETGEAAAIFITAQLDALYQRQHEV